MNRIDSPEKTRTCRWTIICSDNTVLLHRTGHLPVWSVEVSRTLLQSSTLQQCRRLAHQIRQDIWRANRRVRGFLPVVQVSTNGKETVIRAGGSLMTRSGHAPTIAASVARVLDDAKNTARWLAYAKRATG